jgi:thioredoxin-related protein
MRNLARLVLMGWVAVCPPGAAADPPSGYTFRPFDEALGRAATSGKAVFVYFGREGCGYCDLTNKRAFSRPEVKKTYQAHFELTYLDAEGGRRITLPGGERITEAEYGTRLRAFVTPVFLFMDPAGPELLRRVGIQTADDLLTAARFVHEGHYKSMSFDAFARQQAKPAKGG